MALDWRVEEFARIMGEQQQIEGIAQGIISWLIEMYQFLCTVGNTDITKIEEAAIIQQSNHPNLHRYWTYPNLGDLGTFRLVLISKYVIWLVPR